MNSPPSGMDCWVVKYWPWVDVVSAWPGRSYSNQPAPRNGYEMPARWSTISTVPGANVGPLAVGDDGDSAVEGEFDERPTISPMTTRTARTPATPAHTQPRRFPV